MFVGFKLSFFFAFIYARQFESDILSWFITFQNAFRLENLEIVKSQYHDLEDRLLSIMQRKTVVVFILFTLLCVLLLIPFGGKSMFYLNLVSVCLSFLISLYSFNAFNWAGISLWQTMHTYHVYEYKKHRGRLISLHLITLASVGLQVLVMMLWIYYFSCEFSRYVMNPGVFVDNTKGICLIGKEFSKGLSERSF